MIRYLLDTDITLQYLRENSNVVQLLQYLGKQERLGIATITRLEIATELHFSNSFDTHKLLDRFVVCDLNKEIADSAGYFLFSHWGQRISLTIPGAIILATAAMHKLTLVTLNENYIQGLPSSFSIYLLSF